MIKYFNWREKINEEELNYIEKTIKQDGLVIFPTETVYGIGGNALSKTSINKIYNAKKRPREKAINIMVSSTSEIEKYAQITCNIEREIIKNFMPGPLTIILKKKKGFGEEFTSDDETIGIRIPNNEIALKILEKVKLPLIVPSANISNMPSGVNPQKIAKDFVNTVDVIIDGGIIKNGVSSTIVKVEDNDIKILRQGSISKDDIIKSIEKNNVKLNY